MTKAKRETVERIYGSDPNITEEEYQVILQCVDDDGHFDSVMHDDLLCELMDRYDYS